MKKKTVFAALTLQGREIPYEWTRKKVKNLNLRIRADKTVAVSSPHSVTQNQIEAFLTKKANFILRALDKRADAPTPTYREGEQLPLLGRTLTLHFTDRIKKAEMSDELLLLPQNADEQKIKELIRECAVKELKMLVNAFCEEIYPRFRKDTARPDVRFRQMKRCYANCRPTERILTFSTRLIFYPPHFIRYVVMHEFCHFRVKDHSKAFYEELYRELPDAKELQELRHVYRPYF